MTWMDGQDVHLAALFCPGCTGAILSAAEAKNIEFERFQRRIQSGSQKKELWMGCWMGLEGDGGLQESHIISSELYQDQFTVGLETLTLTRLAPWKNEGGFVLCIGSRVSPESPRSTANLVVSHKAHQNAERPSLWRSTIPTWIRTWDWLLCYTADLLHELMALFENKVLAPVVANGLSSFFCHELWSSSQFFSPKPCILQHDFLENCD